ncbi:MAG TPA: type II toxin-antitoxin system HicB family antitoxin [Spirochaetia bacterium]|nr:type II toxin-antitoxin system HicB family antitoxin [Spirochaetia bacterium]
MNESRHFAVIVERGKHNYSAYSPDLPGCVATGSSVSATLQNMKEAIIFHLEGFKKDSQAIPASTSVAVELVTIP